MAPHVTAEVVFFFFEPNGREKHIERTATFLLRLG